MGCSEGKHKKKPNKNIRMSKPFEERQKEKKYEIKIVLLGEAAVGKSSLVLRFCNDKFEDKYKVTIGGAYSVKNVKLKNGDSLKLHIWDTGGQEKFRAVANLYYKDSVAAILVYDVTNSKSFESLDFWIKELNQNVGNDNFIFAMAGNKCDLPLEDKKISSNQAKNFCKENNIQVFNETSAKNGFGVKDLFNSLAQKVYDIQKNEEK